MILVLITILFLFMFLLPFLPGIIEVYKKEDAAPLYIAMDYKRSPRYFSDSFKKILSRVTDGFNLYYGTHNVELSKDEVLEIVQSLEMSDLTETNSVYYIDGVLRSGRGVKFNNDLYVKENAFIGPDNYVRAIVADGSIDISQGSRFFRWVDAEGNINTGVGCDLGISVTSGAQLHLSEGCRFRRLFGMPVYTGTHPEASAAQSDKSPPDNEPSYTKMDFSRRKERFLPINTIENNNVVFIRNVTIGQGCVFKGSIKSYGRLIIEENVTVEGNIFSDGEIIIGRYAKIGGNVFSQSSIHISEKTTIGRPGIVKSVVAKKGVHIKNNVIIYGYVSTEGTGTT